MLLFIIGLEYQMPCESLDGLSGNWDPLKGTRRLPRVDPSGSGHDNNSPMNAQGFQHDSHNGRQFYTILEMGV